MHAFHITCSVAIADRVDAALAGAVFGIAGALAVYNYRHRHVLGQRSSSVLDSLHHSLMWNLKFGLLCPLIDGW